METSASDLPASAARVQAAGRALGLDIAVIEMAASARTAEEAAAACACDLAQIVKSLVFKGQDTGRPILLLVSGRNRVNEEAAARRVGEGLTRPDARFDREATGYAIGGIPPFGHAGPVETYMDESLLAWPLVWAAAGTPRCLFCVEPARLRDATGARVISVV